MGLSTGRIRLIYSTMNIFLMLALGCAPKTTTDPVETLDTTSDGHTGEAGFVPIDTAVVAELHGTAPEVALPIPDFTATNYDGSSRSSVDLQGHPTVIWFFPYAGTPG